MTLLSGKTTLVLCLSSILCGCTTNGLPAPYSINLSFPVITQNQINSGGYGFAPIFPDTCYHLTHYWPAAADIPV
ncbi:hypothetical protein NP223_19440, partial [Salmonella enterica]|nr:hypothetical protein [Salmonella enterica]